MTQIKPCPNCEGTNLFTRSVAAATGKGPQFLRGLGSFLHYPRFDVVVCADCGLTRFFAEPGTYQQVASHPSWQRIVNGELDHDAPQGPGEDLSMDPP